MCMWKIREIMCGMFIRDILFTGDISDCFFCCHTYRSYYISEDKGKTARGKYEFAIGRADRKHETAHQRSRKAVWGYSGIKA